jgi:hypothetical protein
MSLKNISPLTAKRGNPFAIVGRVQVLGTPEDMTGWVVRGAAQVVTQGIGNRAETRTFEGLAGWDDAAQGLYFLRFSAAQTAKWLTNTVSIDVRLEHPTLGAVNSNVISVVVEAPITR